MKITFIRHSQVQKEFIGKYNGHNDISLSKDGKEEAKELAKIFKDKEFDKVYASDLTRVRETIQPFKNLKEIIYTKELREKSWGKHEGLSFEEIVESGIKYENFLQWINSLDGENIEVYRCRIRSFFDKLLDSNLKNILIFTHSGVVKMFISIYKDISLEEAFSISFDYSSYITFDLKKGDYLSNPL